MLNRPAPHTLNRAVSATIVLAACVLLAAAWLRSAEYDEQYTLFLTANSARPAWPEGIFPAGLVAATQAGHASFGAITQDLRTTDVHPPFYFWAVSVWRQIAGPGLFPARLFSVLCGVLSMTAIGTLARRFRIRPVLAMLLTLGCYGFVYTNVVARGFASAQVLTLWGFVALTAGRRWRHAATAGVLLGAACCCNYLAVFVCAAVSVVAAAWMVLPAAMPFLGLDLWFFLAQRAARDDQFPPFRLLPALHRLAEYQVANLFGGLPLYVDGPMRALVAAAVVLLTLVVLTGIVSGRPLAAGRPVRLLTAAAVAPPIGLLALGVVFNNTPIELRYLAFGTPFIALLCAWAWDRSARWMRPVLMVMLATQCAGIAGLCLAEPTMQPARAAAAELAGQDALVLVPRGNDGVGIVGGLGIELPSQTPLLLVGPADSPEELRARVGTYRRVALALLAQDRDSTATVSIMRAAFADRGWRRVAVGRQTEIYVRTGV